MFGEPLVRLERLDFADLPATLSASSALLVTRLLARKDGRPPPTDGPPTQSTAGRPPPEVAIAAPASPEGHVRRSLRVLGEHRTHADTLVMLTAKEGKENRENGQTATPSTCPSLPTHRTPHGPPTGATGEKRVEARKRPREAEETSDAEDAALRAIDASSMYLPMSIHIRLSDSFRTSYFHAYVAREYFSWLLVHTRY